MPRDSKWHQGKFHPQHPQKYLGDSNNIVYRSSWELHFLQWCDRNDNVIEYASEEFSIPYVSPKDNRPHRYYPDGFVKIKHKNGEVKRYVVEIKPLRQTQEPKKPSRVTKTYINEVTTYAVNIAKWKAAEEFCLDNGLEFRVLTENDLGIKPYGSRARRVSKKRHN